VILSLGSINADFVVRVDAAPTGPGTRAGHDLLRTSGGKAANVAVVNARLGTPAQLIGCVGDDDLAAQALRGPRAELVDLTEVRTRPGPTAYTSILVPPDGAKAIVLCGNANQAWGDDVDGVRAAVAAAPPGAVLVVDLEIPVVLVEAALRTGRDHDLLTVLDPAPADRLDRRWLPLVDHLTPDHAEAEQLTGTAAGEPAGGRRAAEALRDAGAAHAYVKLADGGCVLAGPDGTHLVRAPALEALDATGAGDAFAGALAWALHRGAPPPEAARVAVAASTCAVRAYGSQEAYPDRDELEAMVRRVEVARLA
jgi:ribokinase